MKKNLWIVFAAALSTSVLAQDATNSAAALQAPPPEPTPVTTISMPAMPAMEAPTNADTTTPAALRRKSRPRAEGKRPSKKLPQLLRRKKAPEMKTVPLVAGPGRGFRQSCECAQQGRAGGRSVYPLTNGTPVTVLEEIHLKKSGPDEPSAWAKILLPSDTHVWVKSSLLENNAVASKKVNLRAGPGENYGVVGTVAKGDAVQTMDTKGDWTQIQAPANAYAFMAAQYLKQGEEAAPTVAAAAPTSLLRRRHDDAGHAAGGCASDGSAGAGATTAGTPATLAMPTMPDIPT